MDKENNYTFELSKYISHELALETLEAIANAIGTNLYSLGIMRSGDVGINAEFGLGFLVNDVKRMKADNREYYELKKILKKVIS